jgi:signal transduction histidine kinase
MSFTARLALANCAILASALIGNSFYIALNQAHRLRDALEQHAVTLARVQAGPIWRALEARPGSDHPGAYRIVQDHLAVEPSLARVRVVSGERLVFDSAAPAPGVLSPPAPIDQESRLRAAARARALDSGILRGPGGFGLEVVVPVEADARRAVVVFDFDFAALEPQVQQTLGATAVFALASVALATLVSFALASRLTKPIQSLTRGALAVGEGRFERPVEASGPGELRLLADTFNQMAAKLKENVEQLEETNRRLAAANDELKQLDRMKSDLLANVSHELRTPLTAIKGYAEYILDGKLGAVTEKQEKGLVVIQRNLERLSRSISALLDFSTMEVGRIALNLQPFALAPLVEQIHLTLRSELERKQLGFETELEPGLPAAIGDREKLGQVLENLVINAIKFTPPLGTITLAARRPAAEPGVVEIAVRDTGIGIPRDQLGRIFNRFHQVDSSTTRRYGGVGLGLAIVRSILDAHGATVSVESDEGRGTEFRFRLPLLEREEAQAAALPGYP